MDRACRDERERAMLAVLRHTGLRREAVAGLRITDVWDGEQKKIRVAGLQATEKYGQIHHIRPMPAALVEPLDAYLRSARSPLLTPTVSLLFPGWTQRPGRDERPCPSAVTTLVRRLCRRAGIAPPFRPHQFRTHLVHCILDAGGTLETAARFLGHRSSAVTFKHYYDAELVTVPIPMITGAPPTTAADDDEALNLLETLQRARLTRRFC